MSGDTICWDNVPKLVRFDRELSSLSAATIERILDHIGRDHLEVHRDILFHAMLSRDKINKKDDGWSHALLQVCEFAAAKGDQFRELVTLSRWRYWFARFAAIQFRSTRLPWHIVNVRPDLSSDFPDEHLQQPIPAEDMIAMGDPDQGPEGEMTRFLSNLSVLFREVDWADQRLFVIYHFDLYKWLPEVQKRKPKARMTFRLIQQMTGIPNQTVQRAIARVNEYIRTHYAERFGEPIPRHLGKNF